MSTANDWNTGKGEWSDKEGRKHTQWVHTSIGRGDYTPPVSQMKVNKPGKLSAPPNMAIFSGQEPVPSTEGSID